MGQIAGGTADAVHVDGSTVSQVSGEWRRGALVVLTAMMGYGFSTFHISSLGSFVKPLSNEFGWARGEISGVMILLGISGVLLSAIAGRVTDRVGARRVVLVSIWCYAATLAAIGLTGPGIWSWYFAWTLLAIAYVAISPVVWTVPIVNIFRRNRGKALALVLCGGAIVSSVLPIITVTSIETFGWRAAYFIIASLGLLIVAPLTIFCFKTGASTPQAASGTDHAPLQGLPLSEAVRTAVFWKIGFAVAAMSGIPYALIIHMQPIFTDGGSSPTAAAAMVGALGPSMVVGRLAIGTLLDYLDPRPVAAVAFALPIITLLLLYDFDGSMWRGVLAAALLGLALGADGDLIPFLGARYFGQRHFGAIFGGLFSFGCLGTGLAPTATGVAYDMFGSYENLLMVFLVIVAMASLTMLTLGKSRFNR